MFALTGDDLQSTILGCGDGPASFNSEATRWGSRVVSCDPLYRFSVAEIRERIAETHDEILEQARRNAHEFVWTEIASVEALGRVRMSAMTAFLDDFERGKAEGRSARTSSFSTRRISARRFTMTRCVSCAESQEKCGSFPCWSLEASVRLWSIQSGSGFARTAFTRRSRKCRMSFGRVPAKR
jgi:uncharacterized small protein (DUF1192 family)